MSMLDRAYCRDIPPGVNTEDVPETLILSSFQTYVYSCLPGYFSEDLMAVTCLPNGSLSMDYGPNCTGKWQRVNKLSKDIKYVISLITTLCSTQKQNKSILLTAL